MPTAEDVAWLRSPAGAAALAAAAERPLTAATQIADIAALRALCGEHTASVVSVTTARRVAIKKLGEHTATWLLDEESVQQATPAPVAQWRARQLLGRTVHDVTCSIGTEVAALRAAGITAIGSDLDAGRVAMAHHNLQVGVHRADALTSTSTAEVIVADPARRAGGRRITNPYDLLPPLPDLLAAHPHAEMAIKCAPGLDAEEILLDDGRPYRTEIVSVDGGVKEACLYLGGLAEGPAKRAVILRSTTSAAEVYDSDMADTLPEPSVGRVIVDPDGAVVRAGLVRHFAAYHGLWQLDPQIAYLTGETAPPGLRGFVVEQQVGVHRKQLTKAVRQFSARSAEILVRGLDINPDKLRATLPLTGERDMVLVLTRIGRDGVAFLCHVDGPQE